jgi:hypothetical protein
MVGVSSRTGFGSSLERIAMIKEQKTEQRALDLYYLDRFYGGGNGKR